MIDAWASERFGVTIMRDTPEDWRWPAAEGVDLVCLLANADFPQDVREAETSGFMFMDVRVTFGRDAATAPTYARPIRDVEVDAMAALAARAFRATRFYADPGLPDEVCDGFYEAWFRNSIAGYADAILVVGPEGDPGGFVTIHLRNEVATIGLVAVVEDRRGRGLGADLVSGVREWADWNGAKRIEVATQGRDVAAQRLYQRAGFLVEKTEVWLHRWTP